MTTDLLLVIVGLICAVAAGAVARSAPIVLLGLAVVAAIILAT